MKNIFPFALCLLLTGAFPADSYSATDALKIKIAWGSYSDETIIRFTAGATNGFDGSYDAWKMFSGNAAVPNLFTKDNVGDKLAINAMPAFTASHYEDVFVRTGAAATYTISAEEAGVFAPDVCIFMKDLISGQLYDMRTANTYIVSLPVIAVTAPARFRVFFSYPASIATSNVSCTNCSDGSAIITKAGESGWLYSVTNSSGNNAASGTSASASQAIPGLAAGNYTATISGDYTCAKNVPFTINGPVTYYSRASGNWSDINTWSTSGCGGATASSTPGALNNVVICSGNTVTADVSSSFIDLTVNSGTLSAAASFTITGNWVNNGTFIPGTQKVTFGGARLQTISGTAATAFTDLTIYNSAPAEAVRLNVPITVNGVLGLKDGHITTTAANILTCGVSASISLLATPHDSSFVKGPMKHTVNSSSGVTKIFPVGKGNSYRRIDLTVDQKTSALTTYSAEMINNSAAALNYSLPASISNVSYVRYHEIIQSPSNTKLDVAQARIYFGCAGIDDQVESLLPISVAKSNGSGSWIDLNTTPNGYSCGFSYWGSALSGTFTSLQGTEFSLTNTGAPVPLAVSLMAFDAQQEGESVSVSWSTASENNSDYFTVERSHDENISVSGWEKIGRIDAVGNSSSLINYKIQDDAPYYGTSFYRLKETDNNGSFQYSKVVSVTIENKEVMAVYPNPASGYCNVNISGNKGQESSIVISDMIGRAVFSQTVIPESDNETIRIPLGSEYAPGIYSMTASTTQGVYNRRVIIK